MVAEMSASSVLGCQFASAFNSFYYSLERNKKIMNVLSILNWSLTCRITQIILQYYYTHYIMGLLVPLL